MRGKLYTIAYVLLVTGLFTAAVAAVQVATAERIRLNQELATKRVIMHVLGIQVPPDSSLAQVSKLYEENVKDAGLNYEDSYGSHEILVSQGEEGKKTYAFLARYLQPPRPDVQLGVSQEGRAAPKGTSTSSE